VVEPCGIHFGRKILRSERFAKSFRVEVLNLGRNFPRHQRLAILGCRMTVSKSALGQETACAIARLAAGFILNPE